MEKRFDKVDKNLGELDLKLGTVRRMAGENMRDIEVLKKSKIIKYKLL